MANENRRTIGILNCDTDSGENWGYNVTPMTIGVLLEELDLQRRLSFVVYDAHRDQFPDGREYLDGIIITGGATNILTGQPDSAPWVPQMRRSLERILRTGTQVLGVCFGAQAIAAVLGGEVQPIGSYRQREIMIKYDEFANMDRPIYERGYPEITLTEQGRASQLFEGFPQTFRAAESHRNRVTRLPEGAVLLAQNERGIQAYSLVNGSCNAYAVQFHPEMYCQALVRSFQCHGVDARTIARAQEEYAQSNSNLARRVYTNWARNVVLAGKA